MKYYVLLEKKERGCPVGSMQGICCDKFVKDIDGLEYGLKPWYNPFDERENIFPGEMFLISRDKLIAYDVRASGAGPTFHVVSQGFLGLLKDFSVPIRETQSLNVVNSKGLGVSEKKYHIIIFGDNLYEDKGDVVGRGSVLVPNEYGGIFSIENICFKSGLSKDFFKIKNITAGQDPIFCSERFVGEAVKRGVVAGMEFRSVNEVNWASASPDNFLGFLTDDSEPLLFIH
ncbi:Imm43 family immunity protein [Burkholderia cepacia]|uniref:Imm43 family immunity protein n=1 Tax=Burkholderia cepacia TaxID=292 RepID=UPI000AF5AF57|nr:hypothetical protein [Burkholderia cepacia]